MSPFLTQDGSHSIFAEQYGVTYHSRYGAVTESLHVFIDAGLRFKAALKSELNILEVGFGTGLNALLTWREAEKRNLSIRYTGIEAYPLPLEIVETLNYGEQITPSVGGVPDFMHLHQCAWDRNVKLSGHFSLHKKRIRLEAFRTSQVFDLIYFDAFAPQAQPELWTERIMGLMYKALGPDGCLVTYCAKGDVKRTLKNVGFEVERLAGPPGKREMTRAWK